jgi:hypothetical protein
VSVAPFHGSAAFSSASISLRSLVVSAWLDRGSAGRTPLNAWRVVNEPPSRNRISPRGEV